MNVYSESNGAPRLNESVNLTRVLDNQEFGPVHLRVVALCFLIAMFDGYDVLAMAFTATEVSKELAIAPTEMGAVFSAGLIGLMLGSFGFSALGDRIGRKPAIIISCLILSVFSLLTITANGTWNLFTLRLLTGVGMGGIMPNINTLTAEISPARKRAFLMTIMFSGFSLGAFLGALLSAQIVPEYGWRSVFFIGGVLPLIAVVLAIPFLPESPRFRSLRNPEDPEIARLLNKLDPNGNWREDHSYLLQGASSSSASVAQLFAENRMSTTLLVWAIYFFNLMAMYTLLSWLPTILQNAGMAVSSAILSLSVFNLAGVIAGVYFGRRLDKTGPDRLITFTFIAGGIMVAAFSFLQHSIALLLAAVFISGLSISGLQFAMNAIVARSYPTSVRSTGLGWALGIGRLGAIIGPYVFGVLIAMQLQTSMLFIMIGIPVLLCAFVFERLLPKLDST